MSKPNAQEKKWMERIAQYAEDHGCFPHHNETGFQLHHVCGRSGKHNKVKIGNWFILPIEIQYHDVNSNNPWNVTHWRKRYSIEFDNQRDQFAAMCAVIAVEGGESPVPQDVYDAIMSTRY